MKGRVIMEPIDYLKMKYDKENLLEIDDYIKYLEIEFKALLNENAKLIKFKFFSDCFRALDFIQKRFEDFQEEKKDEQADEIEELSEQCKAFLGKNMELNRELKKLHEDKNKLLEQGISLKEENTELKTELINAYILTTIKDRLTKEDAGKINNRLKELHKEMANLYDMERNENLKNGRL